MIGYVCKYTPVELLNAMGADPVRLSPETTGFEQADTLMHPNVCSYAKAVLEDMSKRPELEGIVLTSCCDSIRRLYDTLKKKYPEKFIFCLDLPRETGEDAVNLYCHQLREMAQSYHAFKGRMKEVWLTDEDIEEDTESSEESREDASRIRIGLIGARCGSGLREQLKEYKVKPVFDITCDGMERNVTPEPLHRINGANLVSGKLTAKDSEAFHDYARELLGQLPCLRMCGAHKRNDFLKKYEGNLDGLIYHTVKFCDTYSSEYASLRKSLSIPILKVETDMTPQGEGQIRTRVEAFLESLGMEHAERSSETGAGRNYVLGVDSGSTSTNAVILDGNRNIVASKVIRTGAKSSDSAKKIYDEILRTAGLSKEDLSMIVSTGYGRVSIPYADMDVTEISCHAKGAVYFDNSVRTILDIGGQDSKAIRLDDDGNVIDFVMNDKCAAGTGRFLEMMARTLEMDISELGPESMKSTEDVEISSMCTVFAESEVISLIARNKEKADIANGVHKAIAAKAVSLLNRVDPKPAYMMTGGVALNPGVVKAVEEKIGSKLIISPEPEIIGAVGAALFGLERLRGKADS